MSNPNLQDATAGPLSIRSRGLYSEQLSESVSQPDLERNVGHAPLPKKVSGLRVGAFDAAPAAEKLPLYFAAASKMEAEAAAAKAAAAVQEGTIDEEGAGEEGVEEEEGAEEEAHEEEGEDKPVLAAVEATAEAVASPEEQGRFRNFPESATEPKVYIPFVTTGDAPPRRIEIERKKKFFSDQNIEELLLARGVKPDEPEEQLDLYTPAPAMVALETFDNDDYEVRSIECWLQLGLGEDGEMIGLPAEGLNADKVWSPCRVYGVDSASNKLMIDWDTPVDKLQKLDLIPRINLVFAAEDPFNFADRVAAAHQARTMAMKQLRYNLLIAL
jgi:hypothetical protein